MIDVGHHMLSGWSTGCYYETLSSFHVWIFQLILLLEMKSFFGFMWLLHCSWFLFSCKSFLLGLNEISCIQGSFVLLSTLPEVWNFHARPEECIRYMFSLSLFCWLHKLWRLKSFTSESTVLLACQNPRALISSLTSLLVAVECWRYSPVNYCGFCSTCTSIQTPFNSINVKILMWFCRNVPRFSRKGMLGYQAYCHIHNLMLVLRLPNHIWYDQMPEWLFS